MHQNKKVLIYENIENNKPMTTYLDEESIMSELAKFKRTKKNPLLKEARRIV